MGLCHPLPHTHTQLKSLPWLLRACGIKPSLRGLHSLPPGCLRPHLLLTPHRTLQITEPQIPGLPLPCFHLHFTCTLAAFLLLNTPSLFSGTLFSCSPLLPNSAQLSCPAQGLSARWPFASPWPVSTAVPLIQFYIP